LTFRGFSQKHPTPVSNQFAEALVKPALREFGRQWFA
jgi:hypothetical protein